MPKLGRPPKDAFWQNRAFQLIENDGLGPGPLAAKFEADAKLLGLTDPPSVRTCARFRDAFKALKDPEKRAYRHFSWPESMGWPELPWEASAAALELLAFLREHPSPTRAWERPSVRFVTWYWRATLAAPGASTSTRYHAASSLYTIDLLGQLGARNQDLEWFLAYRPWASAEAERAYVAALESSTVDDPDPVRRTLSVLYGKEPEWGEWTAGPMSLAMAKSPHQRIEQRVESRDRAPIKSAAPVTGTPTRRTTKGSKR